MASFEVWSLYMYTIISCFQTPSFQFLCAKEPRKCKFYTYGEWGFKESRKQQSYPLPLPPNSASRGQYIVGSPWKKGKLLGTGLLGGVYLGFNRFFLASSTYSYASFGENGGMCAMKEVPLSSYGDVKRSANMLEKVADNFHIYYEYMSRGTIYMVLKQYGRLRESIISSYTQQILLGLAYLHSKSIAHGGIKGANVLIDPKGRIKLTNFGIEKKIAERFHTPWMMDSPYWMAQEVMRKSNLCHLAVDIWSLGCTVLEMATSKPPLSQYEGVMGMSKDFPTIPDELSNVCKDFLSLCLQWEPLHRPTAFQLLEHPFVKGYSPLGDQNLLSLTSSVKLEGIDEK